MKPVNYFRNLCEMVGGYVVSGHSYFYLLNMLSTKAFYGICGNDENRAEDGLALRRDYAFNDWEPCSMLEMMIALAQRMNYIMLDDNDEDRTSEFFWDMVKNLNLMKYDDDMIESDEAYYVSVIDEKLDVFLSRLYQYNGRGGLFPLRKPREDQRNVEIDIQSNAWLLENYGYLIGDI